MIRKQFRRIAAALTAAAVLMTATSGPAFGFICARSGSGQCLHWVQRAATLQSFLGVPAASVSSVMAVTVPATICSARATSSGKSRGTATMAGLRAASSRSAVVSDK